MNQQEVLERCIVSTNATNAGEPYRGKVRDVYSLGSNQLGIVVSDRISAFDHIMKQAIPFKGQILNQLSAFGFAKVEDMVGRVDLLEMRKAIDHYKAKGLDLSAIFAMPDVSDGRGIRKLKMQSDKLKDHYDWKLIEQAKEAIDNRKPFKFEGRIKNTDRTVGTILSNYIVKK